MLIRVISFLILFGSICFAQDSTISDSSLCKTRGHIKSDVFTVTLMYFHPSFEDLPDRTIIISHDENIATYFCLRCGKAFSEPVQAKPDTIIVWKKD